MAISSGKQSLGHYAGFHEVVQFLLQFADGLLLDGDAAFLVIGQFVGIGLAFGGDGFELVLFQLVAVGELFEADFCLQDPLLLQERTCSGLPVGCVQT